MNTNKKGFTLIELLVVIVIIGILATISVATFGGYFKKARDSERQSAVQNIATIMKVINATNESVNYTVVSVNGSDVTISTKATLDSVLALQGYSTPASKNNKCYYYGVDHANDPVNEEFFIAVGSEETPANIFIAGTPTGVTDGTALTAQIIIDRADTATCAGAGANDLVTANSDYTVTGW